MHESLVIPEKFRNDAGHCARKNLLSRLGKQVVSSDPFTLEFLARRFVDLFDNNLFCDKLGNFTLPSKCVILDYLADNELSPERHNPHKGAQASEFWGGIFYEHIQKHRILHLDDYANTLMWAYAILASRTGIYAYVVGAEVADKVLSAFRQTGEELGVGVAKSPQNNVIRLLH